MIDYDAEAARYQLDVHEYVQYIKKKDRRLFRRLDPQDPRFDQRRDEGLPFRNPVTDKAYTQGKEPTFWELWLHWWRGK